MISDGKQCSFVRQIDVDFSCFTIVLGRGMRPNIRFAALCADRFRPQMGFAVGTGPFSVSGSASWYCRCRLLEQTLRRRNPFKQGI